MLTSGVYGYLSDYVLFWLMLLSLLLHTWCFFKFFPRERLRKTGLVLGNMLVLSCMLGVVAMAMESYIRFTLIETDSFGVSLPARRWFAVHTSLNSLGCRDREWTMEKPPDVWRIAFVGDSFTYGWGITRVEDRFPDLVQRKFDERMPGAVQVLNVAKSGWNTGDQRRPIEDMIEHFGVNEIVLCYVPNDIEGLIATTADFNPTRPPDATLFNLDSSCLADYVYRRIILPRRPTVRGLHDWLANGYTDEDIWRRHTAQLLGIRDHCQSRDVKLRVVLLPFIKSGRVDASAPAPLDLVSRLLRDHEVDHVDLRPSIAGIPPAELVVNAADAHPNEQAHRLFADAIWQTFAARRPEP